MYDQYSVVKAQPLTEASSSLSKQIIAQTSLLKKTKHDAARTQNCKNKVTFPLRNIKKNTSLAFHLQPKHFKTKRKLREKLLLFLESLHQSQRQKQLRKFFTTHFFEERVTVTVNICLEPQIKVGGFLERVGEISKYGNRETLTILNRYLSEFSKTTIILFSAP